jgi:hypothetical protein
MQESQTDPRAPRANEFGNKPLNEVVALVMQGAVPGVEKKLQLHEDFVRSKGLSPLPKPMFAFNGQLHAFHGSPRVRCHTISFPGPRRS